MPQRPASFRAPHLPPPSTLKRDGDRRRGSARARGYNARWDEASQRFLIQNPMCRGCMAAGLVVASELTDHVEPHRGDMAKFWNAALWQPACRFCHDVVKKRLEALFDQGKIGVDDLWLDSAVALRLAAELRGGAV